MIENPNFDYQYDFATTKSFSMRLSLAILTIAASVFLVALLIYFYFEEETVREKTAQKARTELHDAVLDMRMKAVTAQAQGDTVSMSQLIQILAAVHPYRHSCTLMADSTGQLVHVGDSSFLSRNSRDLKQVREILRSGKGGMEEVFSGANISLLIHENVGSMGLRAALVCSRTDILLSYRNLIFYGALAFILGLLILFACCAAAIYRMVRPLHLFAESAMSIADGNLDTPLPDIKSEDELLQLRNSFEHMQNSLKQYIEDLKITTAAKEHIQSELTIAHDIQMGMIPKSFPQRDDIDLYASMKPAREVGGDLYDFIIDNDELFFIIGDVAGKGVPASLYMAVTRTLFRNLAGNYQSASNIVREINRAIASDNDSCIFVTLFVGVLDLRNNLLTYCNAAHNAPILIPAKGPCSMLDVLPNVPVGAVERFDYVEQQTDFPPGTALLLYTDGLTEAMNHRRQLFGEQRLLKEATMSRDVDAIDAVRFMQGRVEHFADGAEQSDDLTMLFLRHQTTDTNGKTNGNNSQPATPDERHLRLKNELAEIERMRTFVLSVCREQGATDEFAKDVNLAVEEAVVNIVNYAYKKGTRGPVDIFANQTDEQLMFRIEDWGTAFDPTQAADADTTLPLEQRNIGGLGIHLVRQIMDTIEYQRTEDGRNVLLLGKRLETNEKQIL